MYPSCPRLLLRQFFLIGFTLSTLSSQVFASASSASSAESSAVSPDALKRMIALDPDRIRGDEALQRLMIQYHMTGKLYVSPSTRITLIPNLEEKSLPIRLSLNDGLATMHYGGFLRCKLKNNKTSDV